MCPFRVVVIEDEQAIRRGVADALRASGYEASEAGVGGLEAAVRVGVDLVLLDLMPPRLHGLECWFTCPAPGRRYPSSSSRPAESEDDRIRGLKMGADDYIVKPFSALELLCVGAVLRRSLGRTPEVQGASMAGSWAILSEAALKSARSSRRAQTPLTARGSGWGPLTKSSRTGPGRCCTWRAVSSPGSSGGISCGEGCSRA